MSDKAKALVFYEFKVTSFAKIDNSQPVIVVFPDGVNACLFEGDQAVGKTSMLEAFKTALGLPEPENAENRKDHTKSVGLEFKKDGRTYRVKVTKSRFELEELVDDKFASHKSPKTMLSDLIGPVGLSPMFLKQYDGKKQVEWLRNFYRLSEDQLKMEKDINDRAKEAYTQRREVKKSHKEGEEWLKSNVYYNNRFEWAEKLKAFVEVDIAQQMKKAQEDLSLYSASEQGLIHLQNNFPVLEQEIVEIDNDIIALQNRMDALKEKREQKAIALTELDTKIKDSEKYLAENIAIKTRFDEISIKNTEQENIKADKAKYDIMIKGEARVNDLFKEITRWEGKLDELRNLKKKFIQTITPDVEGLEVFVADEENPKEGLYYEGREIKEISESELWGLYSKLLEKLQVKVILIENISSLGSNAIKIFNDFIAAGGYIMATQMDRVEKNLKITLMDKFVE